VDGPEICERRPSVDWPKLARQLTDSNFGVGSDGLAVVEAPVDAAIRMRIFNSDGSETEMSDPNRETFARLTERVCRENGFALELGGARVSLPEARTQLVALEQFEYLERERVRLWARIGPEADIGHVRMEAALRANAGLPHGALGLRDESLILSHALALDEVGADELEAAIHFLAETAGDYEKTIFGTGEN
jgi:diaminopimelate epimerase